MDNTQETRATEQRMIYPTKVRCPECHRVFDLTNPEDAEEVEFGHDCEGEA